MNKRLLDIERVLPEDNFHEALHPLSEGIG